MTRHNKPLQPIARENALRLNGGVSGLEAHGVTLGGLIKRCGDSHGQSSEGHRA
jgi:hypothetical protein